MDCCQHERELESRTCPRCGSAGRSIQLITVKSLLTARALERLTLNEHRFCATPDCEVVYFSEETLFGREDVSSTRVFRRSLQAAAWSAIASRSQRMTPTPRPNRVSGTHVQAGRCACELRNPEGRCCLGNLRAVTRVTAAEVSQDG